MNREDTIKTLEQHVTTNKCEDCPYMDEPECDNMLLRDLFKLLKEDETNAAGRR